MNKNVETALLGLLEALARLANSWALDAENTEKYHRNQDKREQERHDKEMKGKPGQG